jgi:hypothetical protein
MIDMNKLHELTAGFHHSSGAPHSHRHVRWRQRNPAGVVAVIGGVAMDVTGAAGGVVVVAVSPMVMLPWMKVAPVATPPDTPDACSS